MTWNNKGENTMGNRRDGSDGPSDRIHETDAELPDDLKRHLEETRDSDEYIGPARPVAAAPGYDPNGTTPVGAIGIGLTLFGFLAGVAAFAALGVFLIFGPITSLINDLDAWLRGPFDAWLVEPVETGAVVEPEQVVDLSIWVDIALGAGVAGFAALGIGVPLVFRDDERIARRKEGQVLTDHDLAAAPQELRDPMRAAADAAETIRTSTAYTDGWLTDVDLDAALWDLAEHVKIGAQLHTQLAEFADDDQPERPAEIDEARTALRGAIDHIRRGAERLVAIAEQVGQLDEQLAEPQRRAALEAERDRQAADTAARAAQLAETSAALQRIDPALDAVADTITGRLDAYAELPVHPERA